ncbi:MAG TPA: YdeI/OmpD-associated family protein [Verrucomicrobiota bacterium]|nr:YdeI/OmpD-associated family protein [Verrucomicrobiota bacterium]
MDCSRPRTRNPGEWLETCPDFSQPLAEQVVEWILTWEPDLTESIKWNMLCFSGRKLVCGLSACKRHLGITFFRGTELDDPGRLFNEGGENNTNIRSIRLTTLDGFNVAALRDLLNAAVALDTDATIPPLPKVKRKPWPIPAFFKEALAMKQHRAAAENFRRFSPTSQREYLVWLTTAKLPETRARRLKETLAALAKGRKWAQRKLK